MKAFLRRNFTTLIAWIVHNLQRTRLGRFIQNELQDQIINHSMQMTEEVNHKNCLLRFTVPNMINRFRAGSFSTKEPETLEWIDSIPKGSVVWSECGPLQLLCSKEEELHCLRIRTVGI